MTNIKHHNATHGLSKTPEHNVWQLMKQRCTDPNVKNYHRYGGRGIKVCDRWLGVKGFENFLADMGRRPAGKSLERINNNKGYSPENCKWAEKLEQANNTHTNRFLTYEGKTMTIAQWAREVGLSMHTLYARLFRLKWPIDRALTERTR